MFSTNRFSIRWIFVSVLLNLVVLIGSIDSVRAQENEVKPIVTQQELESLTAAQNAASNTDATDKKPGLGGMNFLNLLWDGGTLMIPIGLMSLLVVAIGAERFVALRSGRVFPRRLRREIRRASDDEISMSPAELFRTAELFPSPAGRVLKDLLSKVGRPIPEAEACINESVQREADRLYGNVRWLTLAAAVTPLIGLLGTVWGMILAFYNTTQLTSGSNRVESLAEGIYVALVTTLAGLAVAIPAAILAHYFEGKITKTLGQVDHELRSLLPRLEQYEGRTRFDITSRGISSRPAASHNGSVAHNEATPASPPPVRSPKMKT
jgi:biopolymer transport protein ExbB